MTELQVLRYIDWYVAIAQWRDVPFQLIPNTCWGQNVRSLITESSWGVLSKKIRNSKEYVCEYCGELHSEPYGTHCHEEWVFDIPYGTQRLFKLKCVCKKCHDMVHIGRTMKNGTDKDFKEALLRYQKINEIEDMREVEYDYLSAVEFYKLCSLSHFKLDSQDTIRRIKELYDYECVTKF